MIRATNLSHTGHPHPRGRTSQGQLTQRGSPPKTCPLKLSPRTEAPPEADLGDKIAAEPSFTYQVH